MSDVQFIDAREWMELSWFNSGGTRAKRVLQSPAGKEWFFKCSERKEAKDGKPEKYYRYEFWSEVIAYQVGKSLGLDILRYDPGTFNNQIGCISPMMITPGSEQLVEVGRYMAAVDNEFSPDNLKTRVNYTFQLLVETLDEFNLTEYLPKFFETLLFDAIIGNTDRHQENWAFIAKTSVMSRALDILEEQTKQNGFQKMGWLARKVYRRFIDSKKNKFNKEGELLRLQFSNILKMAPIYDSGSSLARELSDQAVNDHLNSELKLIRYIEGGKSEVHWANKKLSHFELAKNLLKSSYIEEVQKAASFLSKWDDMIVKDIVNTIDSNIPDTWAEYRIPESRKNLIFKLLTLRAQKLKGLING